MLKIHFAQSGATLVETMVAFSLMASLVVAIYPVFTQSKATEKYGDSRQLCENVVRSKLDEYRFGRPTNIATEMLQPWGNPRLTFLSVSTLSDTTVSGLSSGGSNPATNQLESGGFFYSKVRYNEYFPNVCNGQALNAKILNTPAYSYGGTLVLGMRECIGTNIAWADSAPPVPCPSAIDQRVQGEIPGFKLYVKLELSTPWPLAISQANGTGVAARRAQYDASCPNDWGVLTPGVANFMNTGTYTAASPAAGLYDFNGAGDAIKITVTGVMDFASLGPAVKSLGGVSDANRLQCSISATIRPEGYPIRYYLTHTGRVYTANGHGLNGTESAGAWVYQSLYSDPVSGGAVASNISSFAVHPRHFSVYVLRHGSITRYSNCGNVPIDCDIAPSAANGISDDGSIPTPSVQEFQLPQSIGMFALDFRSGTIYGMTQDHTAIVQLALPAGGQIGAIAGCDPTAPCTLNQTDLPPTNFLGNFLNPNSPTPRLTGFFISPEGDEAFVSDRTGNANFNGTSYGAAIYRARDQLLGAPIAVLPMDAVTFSK